MLFVYQFQFYWKYFTKTNCEFGTIALTSIALLRLVEIFFSRQFQNTGSIEIGLQFESLLMSPPLCSTSIFVVFMCSGNTPVNSAWLKMCDRRGNYGVCGRKPLRMRVHIDEILVSILDYINNLVVFIELLCHNRCAITVVRLLWVQHNRRTEVKFKCKLFNVGHVYASEQTKVLSHGHFSSLRNTSHTVRLHFICG